MDFDYTTETITPDSTNILTIGGTGGLEFPVGATNLRPGAPVNGTIRYNSTTNTLEGFFANQWVSTFAPINNQIFVQKDPGAGQYGSIAAACEAVILNATALNPWEILVAPGTYVEPEIHVPPYVHITGLEEYGVIVRAATANQHVFVMDSGSSLNFMVVAGAGLNFVGIQIKDIQESFVVCHKVGVYDCDTGINIESSTANTTAYLEYCDTNGSLDTGISITSANGFSTYANVENTYVFGVVTNPTYGIFVSGVDTTVDMVTFGATGILGSGIGTALHIQDGASVFAKTGAIFGWNIGILIPAIGESTSFNFLSGSIGGNVSLDLQVLHPDSIGIFNGTARSDLVDTSLAPKFTLSYSDQLENRYIQTGDFFLGPTGDTITNVSALIIDTPPTGLLEGGVMTSSGLTVNVTEGSGYIRKNDLMTKLNWGPLSIAIPASTQPYLYIDNNGVLQQAASIPSYITNIVLGRAAANATEVYSIGKGSVDIKNYGNKVEDYLRDTIGPIFVSGSIVSENGTTPRAFDVSSGNWYYGTQHRFPSAKIAPTMSIPIHTAGVLSITTSNLVPNTSYDNGTDLIPLAAGTFTKHALYQLSDGIYQTYILAYGQAQYPTEDEAIGAPLPFPYFDPGPTPTIAAFVVQQGVNSLPVILDQRPLFGGGGGGGGTSGSSVHGDLLGLDADDHTQYLLVDGTRSMGGNLNMGTFNLTNVGTVNGVTVQAHASRHLPSGADPLATGVAVGLNPSSTNTEGIANTLARSDHTHQITLTNGGLRLYAENPSTPVQPVATGANSIALGSGSSSVLYGSVTFSNGNITALGDSQRVTANLRNVTTNATPVELFLDGAAGLQRLVLPNNSAWTFEVKIIARRTDLTGSIGSWIFQGLIYRDSTAATTVSPGGSISKTSTARVGLITATNDPILSADVVNGSLKILVTGNAAQTIRWVASVDLVQVTN